MNHRYVADTMAVILRLEKRKLPIKIKEIFESVENNKIEIIIPAIVLAEIGYLSERKKIEIGLKDIDNYLAKFSSASIKEMSFTTIKKSFEITDIPELHDRLIAGTSKELESELLTNDPKIRKSSFVDTIWD